jgi:hypothetical protein
MVNLVGTRAVGPPSPRRTTNVSNNRLGPVVVERRTADRSASNTRVTPLHGPYRKNHRDYSCVRVVAASAIVAGLLLGTAPLALAQVGHLLATVPAAFAQEVPSLSVPSGSARDVEPDNAGTGITMQYRLDTHAARPMISWNGTSQALKCSYGLLFQGNTRSCQAA